MIATIILICLASGKFLIESVNHGKEEEPRKHNIIAGFFATSILLVLYYYAGLFDKF